ncbi:MAG TPA: PHP domain-containing protein [Candidatus Avacidaminococcus intestinavium]|uniref:PHP domain-containing protein n=1 Tax=Candidatus Avacidaminococcus intestinavium TaxID=2840684 RepID=A0A9D1MQR5_9FIRM|nr:PHP domain-containing protein [Candidatus Avacidaminococcus intestinavium]
MKADLHIHTTFSDGIFTPKEIVTMALASKLQAISITDHDAVEGVLEAQKYIKNNNYELKIITGIELGTQVAEHAVHILGYHFDCQNDKLRLVTANLRLAREKRLTDIVAKVKNLGYNIGVGKIDGREKSFGRPYVAKQLVKAGYFKNVQEAFNELLGAGKPGYIPQPKLSPKEAIDLLHAAGGIAILAHPSELNNYNLVQQLLTECQFDGIEVWHPSADQSSEQRWLHLATELGLLVSGGSDFHGHSGRFPEKLGDYTIGYNQIKNVIEYS